MRINEENKSLDMEARDINYLLPHYVKCYLFYTRNEMPTKIVFPMFSSIKYGNVMLPIEWIAEDSQKALAIAKDGEIVPEVTEEQEKILDDKDAEIERLKKEIADMKGKEVFTSASDTAAEGLTQEEQLYEAAKPDQPTPAPEDVIRQEQETQAEEQPQAESPAKAAFATPPVIEQRTPKQPPGGDIGPGQHVSEMHSRDTGDQLKTTRDLIDEPEITGVEKEFEKTISRDEAGMPKIEGE